MDRIQAVLARRAERPLVIPFVTAGFPEPGATVPVVCAMGAAGADMIEIGIPFSDPLADGPTIQAASETALAGGMTLRGVLTVVREVRLSPEMDDVPLLLMGYCNPLLRYGLAEFVRDAADAGVDGLIVPDLPPEEAQELSALCQPVGLSLVFLIAPNTSRERIGTIDSCSTDFSYCVSITGVTGASGAGGDSTVEFLQRVGEVASKPFVVGFGIKNASDVKRLGPHAAGVVVGSALIDRLAVAADRVSVAVEFVGELVAAARSCGRRD